MSNTSFEAAEAAVAEILSSQGPMNEDQVLEALIANDVDLGPDPEDFLTDVLDQGERLIMSLADDRWCQLAALLEGRVFTHRLSAQEIRYDMLEFGPDFAPVSLLTEDETFHRLVDGSPIEDALPGYDDDVLAEHGVPVEAVGDEGAWLLPSGHLAGLGVAADEVVGLRVEANGFDVIAVGDLAESEIGGRLSALLEEHFDRPQMLGVAVWSVCADDDSLLREPTLPLSEILTATDLPHQGDWVAKSGFSFDSWRISGRIQAIAGKYRLRNDEARAVMSIIALHEQTRDMVDAVMDASARGEKVDLDDVFSQLPRGLDAAEAHVESVLGDNRIAVRDALTALEEPAIAEAVLSEVLRGDDRALIALGVFAESVEHMAPKGARPALRWLRGRSQEKLGDVERAEQTFRAAESLDPSWPPTLMSLARCASDRGDAERGLTLLRRADVPREHPLVGLLEHFRSTPGPKLGRNEPCWCGSGRKYKQCHLHNQQLPLEERASWLYQKASADMLDGPYAPLVIALAQERSHYSESRDALIGAVRDGLVPDVVLFEGGAFEVFLAMRGPLLPPDEAMLAQQWLLVERSVHEVISVRRGESMQWRDVRTGDVHDIRERTASRQVKPGEMYCARVVPSGETTQIFGGLEPVSLGERDPLMALLDSNPNPLELVEFLSRRFAPPVLLNTEQEPLVMCDATLRVADPDGLASALDGEFDRDVDAPEGLLTWFEHVTTHGVERVRAELGLSEDELRIHANSEARFERVLSTIMRLDPNATSLTETREPADFQSTEQPATSGSPPSSSPFGLPEDPTMVSALEEMILQFEESWLDDHIPALGGRTPRECAADPTRRPDLIKLLDSFPQDDRPGQMSVSRLRSALELD